MRKSPERENRSEPFLHVSWRNTGVFLERSTRVGESVRSSGASRSSSRGLLQNRWSTARRALKRSSGYGRFGAVLFIMRETRTQLRALGRCRGLFLHSRSAFHEKNLEEIGCHVLPRVIVVRPL